MTSACPACGATVLRQELNKNGPTGLIELLRCVHCGLVMQASRDAAYAADLYAYYEKLEGQGVEVLYPPLNDRRQIEILSSFRRAPGRRLLDVGCGIGQFVRSATRDGWDARGIDLATHAVRVAQQHRVRCDVVDFFAPELTAQRFDVITMFEFLEHVASPMAFLERAATLLAPGGLLYLTTPNFDSVERWLLGADWRVIHPEHLLYFTPRSLRAAVRRTGDLRLEWLRAHNVSAEALGRVRSLVARGARQVPSQVSTSEVDLREAVERRWVTRLAKAGVNRVLSRLGGGATLKLLAVRA